MTAGPFHLRRMLLAVVALHLFIPSARAQTLVTLPLDGYYRPGRFFPVRVTSDKPVTVRIDIDNGIGVRAEGTDLTLPVMVLSENERSLRVTIDGNATDLPIRSMEPNRRLMAFFGSPPPAHLSALGDGDTPIALTIPTKRPPMTQAYESLDIYGEYRAAAPATQPSDETAAESPHWTFMPRAAFGPTTSLDDTAPYDAVSGFVAERSESTRRNLWLSMAAFAILALAIALIARPWAAYAVVALAAAWVIAAGVVLGRQSPVTEKWTLVFASQDDQLADVWDLRSSLETTDNVFDSIGRWCRPLFAGQARSLNMWIEPNGNAWRFHYTLPRGMKIGFLCSDVKMSDWPRPYEWAKAPLFESLVRHYYRRPGSTITRMRTADGPMEETWIVTPAR